MSEFGLRKVAVRHWSSERGLVLICYRPRGACGDVGIVICSQMPLWWSENRPVLLSASYAGLARILTLLAGSPCPTVGGSCQAVVTVTGRGKARRKDVRAVLVCHHSVSPMKLTLLL